MSNLKTNINWMLHDHCTSECSYCPTRLRGGPIPKGILDYMAVTTKLIDHYDSLDRKINWTFGGGEPLDMFDFPMMLKLCKERGGNIELTTNGGKLWLDWWAIEPHIDILHLSYHYWQNPNLIKFIIQAFQKANKPIDISVPIRPNFVDEDMQRALTEQKAMQFAQQTPDQQLSMMGYKGGANLGRGLASAFCVDIQDPALAESLPEYGLDVPSRPASPRYRPGAA